MFSLHRSKINAPAFASAFTLVSSVTLLCYYRAPVRPAFDFIGVGAEPLALGNALVAYRYGAYAVYYKSRQYHRQSENP